MPPVQVDAEDPPSTGPHAHPLPHAHPSPHARPPVFQPDVLAAVAAGGVLGALARHGASVAWPHHPGGFNWAILLVNISGCLLIGVLMAFVTQVPTAPRLLRPFLGVGVLGGYTTFSTSIVDVQRAAAAGHAATGLGYLASTLIGAMLAVWAGTAAATWFLSARTRGATARRATGEAAVAPGVGDAR